MLPTNLVANYTEDSSDPSVALHLKHHDTIHAAINAFMPVVVKTAGEWAASDVILQPGQFGIESDTGQVQPGNGASLWVNLPAPANQKVSDGTLSLDLRKQSGVAGDGTADDSRAIINAAISANSLGVRLFATGTFRIDSTVTLACDVDLSGATFNYYGSDVALQLGRGPALTAKTMLLPAVVCARKPKTGWVGGTVGVMALNLNTCFVTIRRISGFETGLYVYGQGGGTAYCTFTVGLLVNNKRNLVLGADSTGWANQNTFIGGRYAHDSSEGENVSGTRHIFLEDAAHSVNNNTWLNPSIEGNVVEQQIDVDGGMYNQWINPRLERSLGGRIRWGASATQNVITGGYNASAALVTRVAGETRNAIRSSNLFELYGSSSVAVTRLQNTSSDALPALAVYGASSLKEADYRWRWSSNRIEAKRVTEGFARLVIDGNNGRYYMGNGAETPALYFSALNSTSIGLHGGNLYFGEDSTRDIGAPRQYRPRDVHVGRHVTIGGALSVAGSVGFFGKIPAGKPTVTGSRKGSPALASLITALSKLGLVTDASTA